MDLGVILGDVSLHKWVIGDGKCKSVQTLKLKLLEGVGFIDDRINDIRLLICDCLNVCFKFLILILLEICQNFATLQQFGELASEWRDLWSVARVENKMHNTAINTLN